jgi:hypothetical protein
VYRVSFFCAHSIGEYDEQNILKLEFALFHLKCTVSTNLLHVKVICRQVICSFLVQSEEVVGRTNSPTFPT